MNAAKIHNRTILIALFALMTALPMLHAQNQADLQPYKWSVDAMWWYSHPSGNFHVYNNGTEDIEFDINKDFGFGYNSTFSGMVDWHFKRKHHFTVNVSPVYTSKTATMTRDITFQGVTYQVGASVNADLHTLSIAPGYQWDFIHRRQGYLALAVSFNLLDSKATLTGIGTVNNETATYTRSASILAPLPIIGPKFQWYPIKNSGRFSLDGSFEGMYFFGYGDFYYSQGTAQIAVHKHLNVQAGYQLGTRFNVHGTNDQIGLRLTQSGPVAGLQAHW